MEMPWGVRKNGIHDAERRTMMAEFTEADLAGILRGAAASGTAVGKLTDTYDLDLPGAYRVQRLNIDHRVAAGERIAGLKMGFTSKAKMAQMGLNDVIWGILTDAMAAGDGPYDLGGLIHPKVEPEVVFRIGRRVEDPADAEAAVDAVAVGYEILDSRFQDYKFALPDVVADNASAAGFGIGPWHPVGRAPAGARDESLPATDISDVPVTLAVNGQPVSTASTAAILDDPWESLRSAARLASGAGIALEPGWIVLAGGITAAVPLNPGDVITVTADGLGIAELRTSR
jgi:2-oxo-3-hexenedioate decarboxylase